MDRSWIDFSDYFSNEYDEGLISFLQYASKDKLEGAKIPCPCNGAKII